jgi:hypothetical protein
MKKSEYWPCVNPLSLAVTARAITGDSHPFAARRNGGKSLCLRLPDLEQKNGPHTESTESTEFPAHDRPLVQDGKPRLASEAPDGADRWEDEAIHTESEKRVRDFLREAP